MIGIIILTSLALVFGLVIVILDSKLKKNIKSEDFIELLPGYNCGVCGYVGCSGMADELCKDKNAYTKCRLLRGKKLEELLKKLQ